MNKNNIWLITAKTNLHVGNENTSSYGLIDKAIQRDALTNIPCINSSSLKGALNEYCSQGNEGKEILNSKQRVEIFGGDKKDKKVDTQKGSYIFFDAMILALPKQDDDNLYKMVTCQKVLDLFKNKSEALGIEEYTLPNFEKVPDNEFAELCSDDNLPIIARNCLENGQSANLWYEQVLPAETVLYTFIDSKGSNTLDSVIKDKIVQIGANATIGYGYCKFTNL